MQSWIPLSLDPLPVSVVVGVSSQAATMLWSTGKGLAATQISFWVGCTTTTRGEVDDTVQDDANFSGFCDGCARSGCVPGVQGPQHRLWGVQQQPSDVCGRLHEGLSCVHDMWPARASLASNRDKGGRFLACARLMAQNALHDALEASHMYHIFENKGRAGTWTWMDWTTWLNCRGRPVACVTFAETRVW